MIITRPQPENCEHRLLMECPLTVDDWRRVHLAWLGFKQQCALIAQEAHQRAESPGE